MISLRPGAFAREKDFLRQVSGPISGINRNSRGDAEMRGMQEHEIGIIVVAD